MRVGIFTESYEPVRNGVAVSVGTLVHELRSLHHHVCVIAPHYPGYRDHSPFVLRVPSILTRANAEYPVPYPWFPRLRREINRLHLDVLHSQTPWFLGLLAARCSKQHNLPHVSTYHTLYDHYAHYLFFLPEQATQNLIEWWLPEFYNQCDRVIVPSRAAAASLAAYRIHVPLEVIPTGIPIPPREAISEAATCEVRRRYAIPQNAPLLLYVGRIAKEKSVERVIEAFAIISTRVPNAYLLVVGGGPHMEPLKQLADTLPVAPRIVFAGPLPR
ncbi:MAG: glycosyltransferase, partial [Chthonomonadales bacterium]